MASVELVNLFNAIYLGNLEGVKQCVEDGTDPSDAHFIIHTDEICLCSTAFENLGLEFTQIASPSRQREDVDFGLGLSPTATAESAGEASQNGNPMTTSRRIYEPPLSHWLEMGRCSHINAREEADDEDNILHDFDEADDSCDDLSNDLDLEVYGIRLSPAQITDDGMNTSVHSDLNERFKAMTLADIPEHETSPPPDLDLDESDEIRSTSSGPSLHGNPEIVNLLANRREDDDDFAMRTPLMSCKFPYVQGLDPVDSEVGSGILISDIKQAGLTPLHVAAARGHNDIISYLITIGCDANSLTSDSEETPLHLAARWGRCSTVNVLLEKGANPNKTSSMECTPMQVAIELCCEECLDAMLNHLSPAEDLALVTKHTLLVYALNQDQLTLTSVLLDKFNIDVNEPLADSCHTLLHKAAGSGSVQCVNLLIEKGAKLDVANTEGETPLHVAAANGYADVVKTLLENGAVCKAAPNWMIGDNQTALMLAAYNNYPDVVSVLVGHDDISVASEFGDTCLHYAAYRGCIETVNTLLDNGALVNARNDYGATPLWNGACYAEICRTLIRSGATIKVKSVGHDLDHVQGAVYDHPKTPLEIALSEGFLDSVQVLVQAGSKVSRTKAQALLDTARRRFDLDDGKDLTENIKCLISSVHSLKQISRNVVMTSLSETSRMSDMVSLPINDEIKEYLRYTDL